MAMRFMLTGLEWKRLASWALTGLLFGLFACCHLSDLSCTPDPIPNTRLAEAFMHTKQVSALVTTILVDKFSFYHLFTALRLKILIKSIQNMVRNFSATLFEDTLF